MYILVSKVNYSNQQSIEITGADWSGEDKQAKTGEEVAGEINLTVYVIGTCSFFYSVSFFEFIFYELTRKISQSNPARIQI